MVNILVGAMGSGKTTYLKNNWLKPTKKEVLCYALIKKDLGNYAYESNFKKYIDKAVLKKDTLFIIDEAKRALPKKEPDPTLFVINGKKKFDYDLITWFLNSRKCNNAIFIVFHSFRDIPLWLLMYTNYIIRFGTKDQIHVQKRRFIDSEPIIESFENYPTLNNFSFDEIKIQKVN